MKKLLSLLAILITISLSAQKNPTGYDGGSELQDAIRKAKNKKTTKTPQNKTDKVIIVQTDAILETPSEKYFREINGYSHPDYVRRVTSTKAYSDYVAETNRLQIDQAKKYEEEAPQRKLDSIAEIEKSKNSALALEKQRRELIQFRRKEDSIQKSKDEAYREEQRQKMKQNNRPRLLRGG